MATKYSHLLYAQNPISWSVAHSSSLVHLFISIIFCWSFCENNWCAYVFIIIMKPYREICKEARPSVGQLFLSYIQCKSKTAIIWNDFYINELCMVHRKQFMYLYKIYRVYFVLYVLNYWARLAYTQYT